MKRILLVCTGNICRSPMAEIVMRREFEQRDGNVEVVSAGTGAWDGASASEGAYLVALENGLDLSNHRARLLTREVVDPFGSDLPVYREIYSDIQRLVGAAVERFIETELDSSSR